MRKALTVLLLLLTACSGGRADSTTVPSTTVPSTTATSDPVTTTPTSSTAPEETTTTTVPLAEPEWGTWSLVLASIPIGAGAEDEAKTLAAEVPGSGVLLSNDFPSLNPDYWVVFFGNWADKPSIAECPEIGDGFTCYPRYLGEQQVVTAVALVGQDLVEIDTATGAVLRTFKEFFSGDGVYRGGFQLSPDRQYLYFSEGWEDSWYSCEASPGSVGRINLATGEILDLWTGTGIALSPDGNFAAYLESSQCLPDPEEPDMWVMTPYDTVVVVDLRIMEPAMMNSQALPTAYDDPNSLRAVAFHPDGDVVVLGQDGVVYKAPMGSANPIQSHPQLLSGITAYSATVAGSSLLTVEWITGADEIELKSHDLTTGAVSLLLTASSWIEVGVDPSGEIIAATEDQVFPSLSGPVTTPTWVGAIDW